MFYSIKPQQILHFLPTGWTLVLNINTWSGFLYFSQQKFIKFHIQKKIDRKYIQLPYVISIYLSFFWGENERKLG